MVNALLFREDLAQCASPGVGQSLLSCFLGCRRITDYAVLSLSESHGAGGDKQAVKPYPEAYTQSH